VPEARTVRLSPLSEVRGVVDGTGPVVVQGVYGRVE
jgi:hypothetical protein